jgi:UDP-N-acetyl-D-glucosamine dehydrogenase
MTLIDLTDSLAHEALIIPASSAGSELYSRIVTTEAVIAVVGLGYVGIPLAVAYAEAGFRVVGIDLDSRRVGVIRNGKSPVEDITDDRIAQLSVSMPELFARRNYENERAGLLYATSDFDLLASADVVIICVPTPVSHAKDPDISCIQAVTEEIAHRLRPGMLVVLESTTYPGTTEEVMLPLLEHPAAVGLYRGGNSAATPRSSFVVGRDFFLAFSPERIDPGRTDFDVRTTPKVVGGTTPACLHLATTLYGIIVDKVVPVSQTKVAELVKLLENTFRCVNIGLVNELAKWCDHLGVDVWEVVEAAATKPFGFMSFRPGPGLGGHCIPVDPHYLAWKLRELGQPAQFIQLAAEINESMPGHIMNKVRNALNADAKSVKNAQVLVLGVAYKPNIGDVRESPALDLIRLLLADGAVVSFSDPHVSEITVNGITLSGVPMNDETLRNSDCVVIETNHDAFQWDQVARECHVIVDTRNAMSQVADLGRARIIKL